jgi:hypothetical protein
VDFVVDSAEGCFRLFSRELRFEVGDFTTKTGDFTMENGT